MRVRTVRDIHEVFNALQRSAFRSRFQLRRRERLNLQEHGLERVMEHARGFVNQRLAPAKPINDGRQTPMRGHPVFIAQHATATCCRSCLERWHHIMRDRPLHEAEVEYILQVVRLWLDEHTPIARAAQRQLFDA